MALTLNNRAGSDALKIKVIGDSISLTPGDPGNTSPGLWGWADAPGGLYEQLRPILAAKTGPSVTTRSGIVTGQRASNNGFPGYVIPSVLKPAQLSIYGLGGSTVLYVTQWPSRPDLINEAQYAQFVSAPADLFIVQWAINDIVLIAQGTSTPSDHLTAYGTMLDRIHKDYPNALVLCMGCLFISEQWSSSGGNHYTGSGAGYNFPGLNPFSNTNTVDSNIRTCAATRPWMEYCDLISTMLAYDVANTTEPGPTGGIGMLSMNGLHPLVLGQQKMGQVVLSHLNIVTT